MSLMKKTILSALLLATYSFISVEHRPHQSAAALSEGTESTRRDELQSYQKSSSSPDQAIRDQTSGDSDSIKIALKYVAFEDSTGNPVLNQKALAKLNQEINDLYAPCKIEFIPEEYAPVDPRRYGLEFNTQSMNDLTPIRAQFKDNHRLVVINTGDWNHSSMGSANAWTTMPGEDPAGAVIEANAATFAGIVAHELGHYLSLDHKSDSNNLMNPIIYPDSTAIQSWQCEDMRKAAQTYWASAIR